MFIWYRFLFIFPVLVFFLGINGNWIGLRKGLNVPWIFSSRICFCVLKGCVCAGVGGSFLCRCLFDYDIDLYACMIFGLL